MKHTTWIIAGMSMFAVGCAQPLFQLSPQENSTVVIAKGPPCVGEIKLWLPEGIATERGFAAIYPQGKWIQRHPALEQEVKESGCFGPGNYTPVDERTIDFVGSRIVRENPVRWRTTVYAHGECVEFAIRLTNTSRETLKKVGAPVCVRFLNAPTWSPDTTMVRAEGRMRSLGELGWQAGLPNVFEAWLLRGESYDNRFYQEFWGFNPTKLDEPRITSILAPEANVRVWAEQAYFLHCNKDNPCTDVMLAFGDVAPGQTVLRRGRIQLFSTVQEK